MAECSLSTLIDEACESGFRCLDEKTFRGILLQLLCDFQASGGGGSGSSTGYTLMFTWGGTSAGPADGATYYFGLSTTYSTPVFATNYDFSSIEVPKSGIIKRAFVKARIGTPGSSELVQHSFRVNDTTDLCPIDFALDATFKSGVNTTANPPIVAGDMVALKVVCPAWVTNPLSVQWYGMLYIE